MFQTKNAPPLPPRRRAAWKFPYFLLFLSLFFSWLVYSSLTPILPQPAEPPRLYSNQMQHDLRQVLLEAIKKAHSSISLIMFGLSDGAILSTISQQIHRGISTSVYYDPNGTYDVRDLLEGGDVRPVFSSGLMHHKVLILDDATVFIGSANMTTQSLRMHDNLVIGFVNKKVASFLKEHMPDSSGYLRTMVGGQDVEFWLLPDPRGHALNALRKRIRNAARSIKLALFTFTHKGLLEELIAAHKRGAEVTVVIDMHSGLGASREVVERLRIAGIRLLFSQGIQLFHHKFAYIDEQMLVAGSANWTKAAFQKNCDSLVILHSLNEEQKRFMNRLWKRIETEAKLKACR